MTILFFLFTFIALNYSTSYETHAVDVEVPRTGENEFAEFEVADEPKFVGLEGETKPEIHLSTDNKIDGDGKTASNKRKVAETTEEFPFVDDEQFEQISSEEESNRKHSESGQGDESIDEAENEYGQHDAKSNEPPKPLTFAEVPSHFRSNWSSYQVEIMALIIISLYSLNYLYGKSKNHAIAYKWFSNNRERLEKQFALVGDDGTSQENLGGCLIRETDFSYSVWCTGRIGCQGMHSQIKLYKRQDLLGMTINLFRPHHDRVIHSIELDRDEMDSFVIVFGQRKNVQKLVKEMHDLTAYVTERKNLEKIHIPSSFCVFAEIAETVPAIIDASTIHFLKKCENYVEYIHLSDQYAGAKQQDDQYVKLPETHPTLVFSYFLIDEENDDEGIDALLFNFTFFILDKIRKYRLSKEGKAKADKKRQNVQENFLKLTHQQRQEAAQTRREEKTRERKQRVMEEEDPNRQKRLEKLELKRDAKQKQPKMKQFKIK